MRRVRWCPYLASVTGKGQTVPYQRDFVALSSSLYWGEKVMVVAEVNVTIRFVKERTSTPSLALRESRVRMLSSIGNCIAHLGTYVLTRAEGEVSTIYSTFCQDESKDARSFDNQNPRYQIGVIGPLGGMTVHRSRCVLNRPLQ